MLKRLHLVTTLSRLRTRFKYGLLSLTKHISLKRRKKHVSISTLFIVVLGVVLGLFLAWYFLLRGGNASAWYNDNWQYRKKLTIDHTKVAGDEDLTDFPVLISLTSDTHLSTNAQADGDDIMFTDSIGNKLDHEIEAYSSGTLIVWVQIPTVYGTQNTDVYMYYGNSSVMTQENSTGVWEDGYEGVWHLNESSDGSGAVSREDSTTNGNTLTDNNTVASTPGKFGNGGDFEFDNDEYLSRTDNTSLSMGNNDFTICAWTNYESTGTRNIVHKGAGESAANLEYQFRTSGDFQFKLADGTTIVNKGSTTVSTGTWYHSCARYDSEADEMNISINGNFGTPVSWIYGAQDLTGDFRIGARNGGIASMDGIIDEVRLYRGALSDNWIATEYENQNSPSTFYSTGYQEERTRGPSAYWKFDEGYGTSVNDSTDNSQTGSLGTGSSAPTWRAEEYCISGKCLQFDGTEDYAYWSDSAALDIDNELTISLWIKPITLQGGTYYTLLYKGNSTNEANYYLQLYGDELNFGTYEAGWRGTNTTNANIQTNQWSHVVVSYSDIGDDIDFYVNGVLKSDDGLNHDLAMTPDNQSFYIGSSAADLEFYEGFIDEVKIYPYVRSADEIKQDYLFSSAKGSSVVLGAQDQSFLSDGLVGYWKMDESVSGDAQIILDQSGNGNDGTTRYGANTTGMDCTVAGKFGAGCEFDDADDGIDTSFDYGIIKQGQEGASYAISAWVKLRSNESTSGQIIAARQGYHGGLLSNYQGGYQRFVFSLVDNANNNQQVQTRILSSGEYTEWNHLTAVYSNRKMMIYLNGNLEDTTEFTGTLRSYTDTFTIGGWINYVVNGYLDDVRIYNRALSSSEVASLYQWAPGPITHWRLDEGSGNTAYDISGNGNDGTFQSSMTDANWGSGKYGKAVSFNDSQSQYARNTVSGGVDGLNQFTASAWARTNDWSDCGECIFFDFGAGTGLGGLRYLSGSGKFQSDIIIGGTTYYFGTGTNSVPNDADWHYYTMTYDSSTIRFYVDGVLTNSYTGPSGLVEGQSGISIGSSIGSSRYFGGDVDDARIYNYARTQKQIMEDMNAGHPTVGTPVGSTVLHLSMDEGYGTTVHDKSPQLNDGTLGAGSSAPTWSNDGKIDKALSFDGTNDYVSISDVSFAATESWSASLWLREDDGESGWSFFLGERGSTVESILYSSTTNQLQFRGSDTTYVGGPTVTRNQWNHAVVTYDNGTMYIYLNGKQSGPYTVSSTMTFNGIGYAYNDNHYFKGKIDEVKIYPFALTADQIKLEYQGGKMMVLGAQNTGAGGSAPSNSAGRTYCVPGDTTTCNAPVLELNFEQGSGQYAYDTSTGGNDGRLGSSTDPDSSDPSWGIGPDHMAGSALSFDGSDDIVSVGNPSDLQITGDLTYSSWIKPNQTGVADKIITKWQDAAPTAYAYLLQTNVSNTFSCYSNDGVTPRSVTSTTTVTANNWYFVSCVRSNKDLIIYVNGVKESTQNYASSNWVNAAAPFKVGAGGNDTNAEGAFYGVVDQVKVYDYARTPAQIAWEYSKGAPIAHYRLDECQGTTANNSAFNPSGNPGNNGTINAASLGNTGVGTCTSGSSTEMWANGASGNQGGSLDFDGSDDRIVLPDIDYGQETTISYWFNSTDNTGTGYQYMYSQGGFQIANSINIYFNEDSNTVNTPGAILVSVMDSNDIPPLLADDVQTQVGLSDSTWHHLVVVINSSGTKAYVDGVQQISYLNGNGGINPSGNIYIGGRYDLNSARFYDGKIDDIRIFNYAMTPTQIKELYNGGAVTFK